MKKGKQVYQPIKQEQTLKYGLIAMRTIMIY